ncbi:MAG: putative peptidoglycan glycosyltransferase FtsW [Candidatus Colwellbacteria bacterium]|nr:putative peptidoglycan glycosyltransferase FtsW [Candidatus Colwellbacteria bacterium]
MKGANRKLDYLVFFSFLVLLLGIGLMALASASSDLGKEEHGDPFYYLKDQIIIGIGIGTLGFLAGYFIDYHLYKKLASLIFIGSIGLLMLLFTPLGIASGAARRWIDIGSLTIQPSELLKLTIVIYLAAWLTSQKSSREKSFSEGLVPFLSIIGFVALILFIQGSTSAAIIICLTACAMYMASGARWSFLTVIILLGTLLLAGFIMLAQDYRIERIKTFIDPTEDVQDSAYQANQALTVIGSGGWTGVGYGNSQAKQFLPERMTDSIFAIIAEETGYVGTMFVILIFLALIIGGIMIARKTRDKFGYLVALGLSTVIGVQAAVHMASASALIPTTGVPLPFISYGNFSLMIFMTMVGIMLNVRKNG